MADLRAFVGHSFNNDDAVVVREFLTFFDHIKKINPDFSWEHAEEAEAKQLAEKVLSIIADKTLFIGICTRKELVIQPNLISKFFFKTKMIARLEDFRWKTSDWIIRFLPYEGTDVRFR